MMQRKSAIAHQGLPFHCPHNLTDFDHFVIYLTNLKKSSKIVDLGCGKGKLLCMLVNKYSAHGIGVDKSASMLAELRSTGVDNVEEIEMDMNAWIRENIDKGNKFDLIICIGSLRQDQQVNNIQQISLLLNDNGYLLIGELTWKKTPSEYFLHYLDMKESSYLYPAELREAIERHAFSILYETSGSLCEYETKLLYNVEKWAIEFSDDPDHEVILNAARDWHAFSSEHAWPTWEFMTIIAQKK